MLPAGVVPCRRTQLLRGRRLAALRAAAGRRHPGLPRRHGHAAGLQPERARVPAGPPEGDAVRVVQPCVLRPRPVQPLPGPAAHGHALRHAQARREPGAGGRQPQGAGGGRELWDHEPRRVRKGVQRDRRQHRRAAQRADQLQARGLHAAGRGPPRALLRRLHHPPPRTPPGVPRHRRAVRRRRHGPLPGGAGADGHADRGLHDEAPRLQRYRVHRMAAGGPTGERPGAAATVPPRGREDVPHHQAPLRLSPDRAPRAAVARVPDGLPDRLGQWLAAERGDGRGGGAALARG
mmetsp:Transcript_65065/g.160193  ORF Transcript_65065/g.160193 Transcript_65065/m.160193 type:complete len:292 (+) Transcript_65065:503-1378(+)